MSPQKCRRSTVCSRLSLVESYLLPMKSGAGVATLPDACHYRVRHGLSGHSETASEICSFFLSMATFTIVAEMLLDCCWDDEQPRNKETR